jgi:hypothetical protein
VLPLVLLLVKLVLPPGVVVARSVLFLPVLVIVVLLVCPFLFLRMKVLIHCGGPFWWVRQRRKAFGV